MPSSDNKYTVMQRTQYNRESVNMQVEDHSHHNENPDYRGILISDIVSNPGLWVGKTALDFGCGCGRNVENLLKAALFGEVYGCDISKENIAYCQKTMPTRFAGGTKYRFITTTGITLQPLPDAKFDFIMSTIVLQHICVHDIRLSLLTDMFRVMAPGGILSIQMGFGVGHPGSVGYHENNYDAPATNSLCDTRVEDRQNIIPELLDIGFTSIHTQLSHAWDDAHPQWIYIKARKA